MNSHMNFRAPFTPPPSSQGQHTQYQTNRYPYNINPHVQQPVQQLNTQQPQQSQQQSQQPPQQNRINNQQNIPLQQQSQPVTTNTAQAPVQQQQQQQTQQPQQASNLYHTHVGIPHTHNVTHPLHQGINTTPQQIQIQPNSTHINNTIPYSEMHTPPTAYLFQHTNQRTIPNTPIYLTGQQSNQFVQNQGYYEIPPQYTIPATASFPNGQVFYPNSWQNVQIARYTTPNVDPNSSQPHNSQQAQQIPIQTHHTNHPQTHHIAAHSQVPQTQLPPQNAQQQPPQQPLVNSVQNQALTGAHPSSTSVAGVPGQLYTQHYIASQLITQPQTNTPPQSQITIPTSQSYTKRERKPLQIINPDTKQAVIPETTGKNDQKDNITKSSTTPSISNNTNNNNNQSNTNNTTTNQSTTIPQSNSTTNTPLSSTSINKNSNNSSNDNSSSSTQVNKSDGANNNNNNQLTDKKKDVSTEFSLQVLNKIQESKTTPATTSVSQNTSLTINISDSNEPSTETSSKTVSSNDSQVINKTQTTQSSISEKSSSSTTNQNQAIKPVNQSTGINNTSSSPTDSNNKQTAENKNNDISQSTSISYSKAVSNNRPNSAIGIPKNAIPTSRTTTNQQSSSTTIVPNQNTPDKSSQPKQTNPPNTTNIPPVLNSSESKQLIPTNIQTTQSATTNITSKPSNDSNNNNKTAKTQDITGNITKNKSTNKENSTPASNITNTVTTDTNLSNKNKSITVDTNKQDTDNFKTSNEPSNSSTSNNNNEQPLSNEKDFEQNKLEPTKLTVQTNVPSIISTNTFVVEPTNASVLTKESTKSNTMPVLTVNESNSISVEKLPTKQANSTSLNDDNLQENTSIDLALNCWTPENKNAKKRYDREFLLSLKDKKLSKMFPDVLRNFEIAVQENSHTKHSQQQSDFRPTRSYGSNSMSNEHGRGSKRKTPGGGSKKDSYHGAQPPAVIQLEKDLQLRRIDNPYVIKRLTKDDINDSEELLREVRNILNKLTPQNLQKLTSDLINLSIDSEDRLKGSIDIIFEKSIDEQVFSQTYAQLCKVLAHKKVPSSAEPNKFVNFRTMLLTRCQKEFDTDYYKDINYDELIQEVERCPDENKKRELRELADEKLAKAKRRSLGNIRFIGELFKLDMLTEGIMNDCIERLLKQESDEENLECLCRLLTTIGKEVDKPTNAQKMKSYFDRLEKIVKKKDCTTARIRFMILDVIDLRKSQWVPRRKDNNPRRIEEIRREAEEEQLRREEEAKSQMAEKRAGQGGQKNTRTGMTSGGSYSQQSLKSTSMDNETFRSKQNGSMANKIKDVQKITSTTSTTDQLLLGPGGGSAFSWNKAKPVTETQSSSIPSSASFSAGPSYGKSQQHSQGQQDYDRRSITSGQSMQSGPSKLNKQHSSETTSRLSMDSNKSYKDKQIQNVKRMESSYSNLARSEASSQASSRETSVSRPSDSRDNSRTRNTDPTGEMSNKNPPLNDNIKRRNYTDEEIDRKVALTVEEYIQNKDLNEALKDCEEFRPIDQNQYIEYIEKMFSFVLERSDQARASVGQLFYHALKEKKIDIKSFTNGLRNTLDLAEDMAIDVPKIATYLSQIIAPIFQKDSSVEFLSNACEPIKNKAICADFISELLHNASNRLGHSTVSEIFKSSNLRINDFLQGVSNQNEFIKEKNLQWIIGNRERTQSASVSTESYEKKLIEILKPLSIENEIIFDKIENEFSDADCKSKAFFRALITSVCRSCLVESKLDANLFKKLSPILTKYIAKNEEAELESLFAVQALDHKMQHQPGFIRFLFDVLYDEDIISETVFWKWKEDVKEEGHAISALSLKAFYDWLSETEPNES